EEGRARQAREERLLLVLGVADAGTAEVADHGARGPERGGGRPGRGGPRRERGRFPRAAGDRPRGDRGGRRQGGGRWAERGKGPRSRAIRRAPGRFGYASRHEPGDGARGPLARQSG